MTTIATGCRQSGAILFLAVCLGAARYAGALPQPASTDDVRSFFVAAAAAYEQHDYAGYLRNLKEAAARRPTHPTILFKLAGAYALNGQAGDAAAVLRKLAALTVFREVARDPDFAVVTGTPVVRQAMRALARARSRRVGTSRLAWTIPDRTFIPEGIAYDEVTRSFFVSSQYQRKVSRIDRDGAVSDFIAEAQDGIWMVFGIAVDPSRHWLWAVSSADPSMKGFTRTDEKRAGLFAFDLTTGQLTAKIVVEPPHYFDDLTVSKRGQVFLSDAGTGAVYTLPPGAGELSVLVAPGTIQGPNGLALTPDGKRLFVSDYAGFIFQIDPANGASIRLDSPQDATLYGIDGLAWYDNGLIGVQNGVDPVRVIRLRLAEDGTRISGVSILEMNHPLFAEPTLGVVAHDTYYYVANSHGGVLRASPQTFADQQLTPPAILRMNLKPIRSKAPH